MFPCITKNCVLLHGLHNRDISMFYLLMTNMRWP
jgi:hypothetical protein